LELATVRFNFRGVGASAGTHADGIGEIDDVLAVVQWSRQRWPNARISLAGFSFGAAMVLGVMAQQALADSTPWLVTVAPPVGRLSVAAPRVDARGWLLIQGNDDDVVDPEAVISWARALDTPPTLVTIPEAGHFFHGKLTELRDAVISWAKTA
jgi:alpha/beta superfamily hydrolase